MTFATFAVLRTLRDLRQTYGLRVIRETALPSGTVYPILARLEEAGWVVSEWEESAEKGPRRRLYRLTPEGVREAQNAEVRLTPSARTMAGLLGVAEPRSIGGAG
jgi:DNA-binding PadR family transcriptional regulator